MGRAGTKAERLLQIEALLLQHPEGLRQSEIASRMGVHRSTIHRMMEDLSHRAIYETEDGKIAIDRSHYLVDVRFSMHEAMAIHIASRLLATHTDRQNQHSASALRKLAFALEGLAPHLSRHIGQSADVMDSEERRRAPALLEALEQLTLAWSLSQKTSVTHRHEASKESYTYIFSPYFIEPYAVGQTTHVIGYREPPGAIRTFKLERIEKVELLAESYELPSDFDARKLLSDAWGIWYTSDEPIRVILRFRSAVAARVKETTWHNSQSLEPQDDGSLLWVGQVAEVQEMLPWIRGWGADCEVVAPPELREMLADEAKALFAMYCEQREAPGKTPELGVVGGEPPYAHSPNHKKKWHGFVEHARAVAELASEFAAPFGGQQAASLLGWWHDAGKLRELWQRYLLRSVAGEWPTSQRGPVHAIVGCYALLQAGILPQLAALIACHHTGLKDLKVEAPKWVQASKGLSLEEQKECAPVLLQELCPLEQPFLPPVLCPQTREKSLRAKAALGWRILHSCLVDADCLDTEAHFDPISAKARSHLTELSDLWARLDKSQEQLQAQSKGTLNQRRAQMYQDALRASGGEPGFFSLTMPTGAGKTRTSMAFALNHALLHDKRRVIVAIPYTSIIEQNADIYRSIFGEQAVLEHHSARATWGVGEDRSEESERRQRLAAQNWDAPIIVTTQAQLFESLFAARNRSLRKLHNIPGSVLVLDEVQTLPPRLLAPTLDALRTLTEDFGCSVVFCTATQPAFTQEVLHGSRGLVPLQEVREIIASPGEHFTALKRVEYHYEPNSSVYARELAQTLEAIPQVLVVCNTVTDTRLLLGAIGPREGVFHLSTRLCGAHRRRVLEEVRSRLAQARPCLLVSTQVVEAGVDLDFPVVYRALGPLDGIVQAAGRCNREGSLDGYGEVHIFTLEDGSPPPQGVYRSATELTRGLLERASLELLEAPATFKTYFRDLYSTQPLDARQVLDSESDFAFATSAERYRLIPQEHCSILVRDPEHAEEIERILQQIQQIGMLHRYHLQLLQPFCVQLLRRNYDNAQQQGWIHECVEGLSIWDGTYDELLGVIEGNSSTSLIFY